MAGVVNPAHPVRPEIADALRRMREEDRALVERRHKAARLARPSAEERRFIAESRESDAREQGRDVARMRELARERLERITNELDLDLQRSSVERLPLDAQPRLFNRADTSFWWAATDPHSPDNGELAAHGTVLPFTPNFADDGLHFTGRITSTDGSLKSFSFGATAEFELQYERIPGFLVAGSRYVSSPHVELFGELTGWTSSGDFGGVFGDDWSKCWLHRRQTVFQYSFGPTGPVQNVVAERNEHDTLIFEENANRSVFPRLPGFEPMPEVSFASIPYPESLWSQLEVRFDVQVEGDALFWLNPEMILRIFQWPLEVKAPDLSGHIGNLLH